jgi:hypothetical protein
MEDPYLTPTGTALARADHVIWLLGVLHAVQGKGFDCHRKP